MHIHIHGDTHIHTHMKIHCQSNTPSTAWCRQPHHSKQPIDETHIYMCVCVYVLYMCTMCYLYVYMCIRVYDMQDQTANPDSHGGLKEKPRYETFAHSLHLLAARLHGQVPLLAQLQQLLSDLMGLLQLAEPHEVPHAPV